MSFDPQNDLERCMLEAANDPAQWPRFYRALINAEILVIEEAPASAHEGTSIRVRRIDWHGKSCIPVFSSLPRLEEGLSEPADYVALNALEFMGMIRGSDLLLNPYSDYGKELTAREIESIIDGSLWRQYERNTLGASHRLRLGPPTNYPAELAGTLSRCFSTMNSVQRAYIAQCSFPETDEKPHTLVAIDFKGEWEPILAGLSIAIRGLSVPDPPVDVVPLIGKSGVEDYFRQGCKPFYQRKRFWIF